MKKTRKNQRFNESKSIDIEILGYRACYKNGKKVPCSKKKNTYKKKTVVKKNNNNILNFGCSKNGKKVPCNKLAFF